MQVDYKMNEQKIKNDKNKIKIPNSGSLPTKQLITPIAENRTATSQFNKRVIPFFI